MVHLKLGKTATILERVIEHEVESSKNSTVLYFCTWAGSEVGRVAWSPNYRHKSVQNKDGVVLSTNMEEIWER